MITECALVSDYCSDLLIPPRVTFVGDWHLNSVTPASRIDDYPRTCLNKIRQIKELMLSRDSRVLICLGDVFHKRDQSFSYFTEVIKVLREFKEAGIYCFSIVGNHDLAYERIDTLESGPLGVLFETGLLSPLTQLSFFLASEDRSECRVLVQGFGYTDPVRAFEPSVTACIESPVSCRVAVGHLFFDTADAHSLSKETVADLGYDLLVLGHDHVRYDPVTVQGADRDTLVIRPGSMTRGTSHTYNHGRDIFVETFDWTEDPWHPKQFSDALQTESFEAIFSQAAVEKRAKKAVEEFQTAMSEIVAQMDKVTSYTSVYDYLDTLEIDPRIVSCIVGHLQQAGVFRTSELSLEDPA